MIERLQSILGEVIPDEPWKPVSRPALVAWLLFYAGFLALRFLRPRRIPLHRQRQPRRP